MKVINLLPNESKTCLLITQAFHKNFCQKIIKEYQSSFNAANTHYPTSYRNNERQIVDNDNLAEMLFDSIKKYIPQNIVTKGISKEEQGEWELLELNSRIRICRYLPNQYFKKHLDGVHYQSEMKQSKLTFMIYLNGSEDFEGGKTLFFNSKEDDKVIKSYTPQVGDLIIFDHNLWHSGDIVLKGEKYILRSDIIYKKVNHIHQLSNDFCQEGHLGYIWKIIEFQDKMITGGRDKKLKIWSLEGKKLDEFQVHDNSILDIIHLTSNILVTCSRDSKIKLWNYSDNQFILIKQLQLHQGTVLSLCKINDSQFLTSGADGMVCQIDINGTLVNINKAHDEWVWKADKLNYQYYITVSEDGKMKIWDLEKKKLLNIWEGNSPINSLLAKSDGNIFIGRFDGYILHFNFVIEERKLFLLKRQKAHNGIIRSLKIDDNLLVSTGEDNKAKVWEIHSLSFIEEFTHNNFVQDSLIRNDSIITVSYDGEIKKNIKPETI